MKLWILTDDGEGEFLGAFTSDALALEARRRVPGSDIEEVESDPVFPEPTVAVPRLGPKWRITLHDDGVVEGWQYAVGVAAEHWIRTPGRFVVSVAAVNYLVAIHVARDIFAKVKAAEQAGTR